MVNRLRKMLGMWLKYPDDRPGDSGAYMCTIAKKTSDNDFEVYVDNLYWSSRKREWHNYLYGKQGDALKSSCIVLAFKRVPYEFLGYNVDAVMNILENRRMDTANKK